MMGFTWNELLQIILLVAAALLLGYQLLRGE